MTSLRPLLSSLAIVFTSLGCAPATAGFLEDSSASLELRNQYINRDFRQHDAPRSKAEEWAQGFIARFESGFTEGTLGFGLDARGALGVKLDSSRDRRGTGLLPFGPNSGEPVDDYSELGLTAKLRASHSVLRLGTLLPTLPVAHYNNTRLLPSTFHGGMLTSQELQGLELNLGRLTRANPRDSAGFDDIGYAGQTSDHFDFIGGTWSATPNLALSAYGAELDDIYRQHFAGLEHSLPLGENMSLASDLRWFHSRDTGAAKAGRIDNRNFNGILGLSVGPQRFSAGWQLQSGDSAFPYLSGGDPYVVNLVTFNTFTRPGEDSWQLRYDYDFASLGIPGLSFMTRYISGDGVRQGAVRNGREWERDSDLAYMVQSGPLRGFNIRLRNVTFRSGNGLPQDIDENRIVLGYSLALW
ncbi:OprD family porin [Metapseudomonas resinovorans]|uniref:Putative phenylacetic acid-specific porin PhaK n=1 Tax=Metapseudomonas resinovorans NBRC 106553 TaxID=1245471 RepID=S6BE62_METRE|nr:OprD family porin [Pseudomonas resinovorans]BAN47369.1 putative phenylacetic acid-specific porin PhaK [Pseudomonas resinovorans NBRC 106553]